MLHDAHVQDEAQARAEYEEATDRAPQRYEGIGFVPQTEREFWECVYDHESAQ
jgi:hypothetical protein